MAQSTNCRHCDGTGIIWWDACDSRGEHVTREEKCPACLVEDEEIDENDAAMAAAAEWRAQRQSADRQLKRLAMWTV